MTKQLEGIKVLLVDDEKSLLDAISQNLIMHGATVYCAEDGLEAMELLKTNSVDFILSDIQMPKSNGIDFLKNLRITYPNPPPFFFLTGYVADYSAEQLKELGANGIIYKPFRTKDLIELITANLKK